MPNRILTQEGWQRRVRYKMGLHEAYLPDSVIEQPDYIKIAEANIIKAIPGYSVLSGDGLIYLESAVVCECASLLCPRMNTVLPVKEAGPHETHELSVDWGQKKSDLEFDRDTYIMSALAFVSSDGPDTTLFHFGVTYPSR